LTLDAYRALLREYEFRSLLGNDDAPKVEKVHIDVTDISSLEMLDRVIDTVCTTKNPLVLHMGATTQLMMGLDDRVYHVDTKKVDITRLVDSVLSGEIPVV
jgi:hypothetical protein